jgi:hypothetical protein
MMSGWAAMMSGWALDACATFMKLSREAPGAT